MKMHSLLCIIFITSIKPSFSQNEVHGRIVDSESSDPIPYVNVWYKGTSIGTFTDSQGYFHLTTHQVDTISISLMGYQRLDIHKSGIDQNIKLSPKPILLNEVTIKPAKSMVVKKLTPLGYRKETLLKTNYLGLTFEKDQQQFWKIVFRNNQSLEGIIRNLQIGIWDSFPDEGKLVISVFLRKGVKEVPLLAKPETFKVDLKKLDPITLIFKDKNILLPDLLHAEITFIGIEKGKELEGGLLDVKYSRKKYRQPVVFHRRSKDQPWEIAALLRKKNTYQALNIWLDVAEF